jgi:hypothetical protein
MMEGGKEGLGKEGLGLSCRVVLRDDGEESA